MTAEQLIDNEFGKDGFQKSSTRDTFIEVANALMSYQIPDDQIRQMIRDLLDAAWNECDQF